MYNYEKKTGHPVLGIVLGILGIIAALLLCLFTGVIGGAVAGILGLAAVLIGMAARKGGRGIGAIVAGALAIILAVVLTVGSVQTFRKIQDEASKYIDEAPLVVKCLDKPYLGLVGMIINLPKDEGTIQELTDQFNLLKEKTEGKADTAAAPAETTAEEAEAPNN